MSKQSYTNIGGDNVYQCLEQNTGPSRVSMPYYECTHKDKEQEYRHNAGKSQVSPER